MRRFLVPLAVLAILALSSCTTMRRAGHAICEAQDQVSAGITNVGAFFGAPGSIVSGVVNIALEFACSLVDTTINVPGDVLKDVGLGGGDAAPAAPAAGHGK